MNNYDEAYTLIQQNLIDLDYRELQYYHKIKYGLDVSLDSWEIKTRIIGINQEMVAVTFWIQFPKDFPIEFPNIYLHRKSYPVYKYFPHIESDGKICIFTNQAQPSIEFPHKVVKVALSRAKSVLEDGMKETNLEQYAEEFESYWAQNYSSKEKVLSKYLIVSKNPLLHSANILILNSGISGFKYIIYQNEEEIKNIKLLLREKKITFLENTIYIFEELPFFKKPPFNLTNAEIAKELASLPEVEYKRFESFFNLQKEPKIFLFKKIINNKTRYFGWKHRPVRQVEGFRRQSVGKKFTDIIRLNPLVQIDRIYPQLYSANRLVERSDGSIPVLKSNRHYSFAGLGSLGSNLAHMLDGLLVDYTFIDNDYLSMENTARHLLGFDFINQGKSEALRKYFISRHPLRKVLAKTQSVLQTIKNEPETINNSDCFFVCIGEYNKEAFISDMLNNKVLTTPTFIIWVEPYLTAGHCIYLNPNNPNYEKFHKNGNFIYNLIKDYSHESLNLQEAGCQSIYTPYSNHHVICFLGTMLQYIQEIIANPLKFHTQAFTWIGDINIAKSLDIELIESASQYSYGEILKFS